MKSVKYIKSVFVCLNDVYTQYNTHIKIKININCYLSPIAHLIVCDITKEDCYVLCSLFLTYSYLKTSITLVFFFCKTRYALIRP